MALIRRKLKATFVLGEGDFGEGGSNQVELTGLRMSAEVMKAGGPSMGTLELKVWGMTLSMMNKLSTLGMVATTLRRNSITLDAGDDESGMATVFQGTITNAWTDFRSAPDVPFQVLAHTGLFEAVAPAKPTSFKGSADVATIMSGLATQLGVSFENNNVKVKLSNPYFSGSARSQALAVVEAAGIEWNGIDNGVLAIWSPGEGRGGQVPLISPKTGMKGYPTFASNGIMVECLFNPSIRFGGKIKVESDLKPASGEWTVYQLDHHLACMMPRGQWHSSIAAAPVGLGPFVP